MKPASASADTPAHRLAIVLSHPTQYYSPWFRWLRDRTELTFRVFYLWDFGVTERRDPKFQKSFRWDIDLLGGYESEFVPNRARDPGTHHFFGLHNPSLPSRLAAFAPTAVFLFGYNWRTHFGAIAWARRRGIPLIFRGDSHLLGRETPGLLRRWFLSTVFRQFAAFLPVGLANRRYLQAFGVPEKKLFTTPHAVDASRFITAEAAGRISAAELRRQLGIAPDTRVVLFAGKLVPEKQPRALLAAFLAAAVPGTALVFVGDGPEKSLLLSDVAALASPPAVHFLPFANQSEMPARYLLADLFVLPSRGCFETWGLAVNEAMHLGVPALVSDRVGCHLDLVSEGETRWVFASESMPDFVAKLRTALGAVNSDRAGFAARVRCRIAGYTFVQVSEGLLRTLAALPARQSNS